MQGGGAVPDVVGGAGLGQPGADRQDRGGAVQRLNLGLLVHAQHHRLLRRVQIQGAVDDWAHPWSVAGHTVVSKYVEFACDVAPLSLLSGQPVTAVVEAPKDHTTDWKGVLTFVLHVEAMAHPARYITYSNHPHLWQAGELDEAW